MIRQIKYILILSISLSMTLLADVEYSIIPLEPANYQPSPSPSSRAVQSEAYDLSENGHVVGSISNYPYFPLTKSFIYHPNKGFQTIFGPLENGDLIAKKINNKGIVGGWINKEEWQINEDGGASCTYVSDIFIFDHKNNLFKDLSNLDKTKIYTWVNEVLGIADNGKILITGWDDLEQIDRGYIYDMTTEEVNFAISTYPVAINNAGNVIGDNWYYSTQTGIKNLGSLDPYGRWYVTAQVLSENNVVAGIGDDIQEEKKGFIWDEKNGMRIIYTLGGDKINIKGINCLSQVVGSSKTENMIHHAFIFDESLGTIDLGTLGGEKSCANSINDLTQIVGYAESYSKAKSKRAFIWDKEHGMRDLNDLIPRNSGWKKLEEARKINNRGYIIGNGVYKGEERGFLLIPKYGN